jgi:hypothetical protein
VGPVAPIAFHQAADLVELQQGLTAVEKNTDLLLMLVKGQIEGLANGSAAPSSHFWPSRFPIITVGTTVIAGIRQFVNDE